MLRLTEEEFRGFQYSDQTPDFVPSSVVRYMTHYHYCIVKQTIRDQHYLEEEMKFSGPYVVLNDRTASGTLHIQIHQTSNL